MAKEVDPGLGVGVDWGGRSKETGSCRVETRTLGMDDSPAAMQAMNKICYSLDDSMKFRSGCAISLYSHSLLTFESI